MVMSEKYQSVIIINRGLITMMHKSEHCFVLVDFSCDFLLIDKVCAHLLYKKMMLIFGDKLTYLL